MSIYAFSVVDADGNIEPVLDVATRTATHKRLSDGRKYTLPSSRTYLLTNGEELEPLKNGIYRAYPSEKLYTKIEEHSLQ